MVLAPLAQRPPTPLVGVGTLPAVDVSASGLDMLLSRAGLIPAGRPVEVPRAATPVRPPAIGVDTSVIPVGVDADRALAVPADPGVVGWWQSGAKPRSATGRWSWPGTGTPAPTVRGAFFPARRAAAARPRRRPYLDGHGRLRRGGRASLPKAGLPADVFCTTGRP